MIDQVITEMGVTASESDIEILQRVCAAVSIRAAKLSAAGIAAIVKVCYTYFSKIYQEL